MSEGAWSNLAGTALNMAAGAAERKIRHRGGYYGYDAKEAKQKQMFGEIVRDIMTELNISWQEAKAEYKKRRVEKAIKRELNLI